MPAVRVCPTVHVKVRETFQELVLSTHHLGLEMMELRFSDLRASTFTYGTTGPE